MTSAIRPRTRRARRLRREASDSERLLWCALREANLPVKVRRQHPIGRHIADFAIPARKLAIEIDGGQHAGRIEADAERTQALNEYGYRVIRFWSHEVLSNIEGVLQAIVAAAGAPPPLPDPLRPQGRRGNESGATRESLESAPENTESRPCA
ncbi:MAG: endonuclease domain-containing protein [Alphaproteobacteria bacterium]